jgi:hypothetical protein
MKRLVLLLALPGALLTAAELSAVRSVYLMPMYRGLDQYLANRLTNEKVFQVVTDPSLADAVFTDRIGQGFQLQLETFVPVAKPEPAPAPAPKEAKAPKNKDAQEPDRQTLITETINKLDNPGLNSSFGRGKGTLFLVDMKSRQVIWSTYEPAPSSVGKEMDRTSTDVVNRLMKDMGLQKKK